MSHRPKIGAILLMSGDGVRFGSETPKQFLILAGKPIYLHTLELFSNTKLFDEIILVCHPNWIETVRQETKEFSHVRIIAGGKSRQESSRLGVLALPEAEVVVIHDAVRPFVSEKILRENVAGALQSGAVDTCIPSADTIVHAPDGKTVDNIPPRAHYLRGQTPQSFRRDWIAEAHQQAAKRGLEATDDCRLIVEMGRPVQIVLGAESNIKITTELDLFLAEQLFRLRLESTPRKTAESLKGKIFAVVGGNGGIGSAIRHRLEQEGARAISLSRSTIQHLDLQDPKSVLAAFNRLHEEFGPLDGLINCAGKLVVKPLQSMSLTEIEEVLAVNLHGLILCCRYAQLKPGAHLINIASSSFTRGRKNQGVYSGAKAGVVNFTQAVAEERPDLRVWAIVPQRTDTPMRRTHFPEENPASLLHPDEIGKKVVEILHDKESTGQLLEIRR